ncbi:MAG TPA: long-chain-fatty-acid--CoA ligase [Quisquiliibacterium sp.]|nr:long-chain-fatty-acid--CoA ligase [Quisquiliibacterium sp.]
MPAPPEAPNPDAAAAPTGPGTLRALVVDDGRDDAERAALICDDETLTHGALRARVAAVARALLAAGVRAGDRVAILLPNGAAFLEAFFGTTAIGAIAVPLNTRLHPTEHAALLQDCTPVALMADAAYGASIAAVRASVGSVHTFVTAGPRGASPGPDVDAGSGAVGVIVHRFAAWRDAHAGPLPAAAIAPDQPASILYTSGTTSQPKGVVLSHGNYRADIAHVAAEAGADRNSVNLQISPLYHAACVHTLAHLAAGGTTVLPQRYDADAALAAIARHRVTYLFAVPTVLYELLDHPGFGHHDLRSLRRIAYGAAAISGPRLEQALRAFGPILMHAYGLTETSSHASVLRPDEHLHRAGSIGRGLPGVALRVVDDAGCDVAPGGIGEILVRGPNVMTGYWSRPQETAAVLRDGWLHTGDLARIDADGYLFVVDRIKDLVISGGVNVYPRESEHVLAGHPAVADVAVFGVPDPHWGEALAAAVVLRPGQAADAQTLLAFARTRLGAFKLPKRVHFLDQLPKTASGKVRKADLRARFQTSPSP